MPAGLLIVFEGAEGAGKTTQIGRLSSFLEQRAREYLVLREPGGTRLGEKVREILLDPANDIVPEAEALLFMASRAELVRCVIGPALREEKIVILDRFFLSTYAYQVGGRELPEFEVRVANTLATGGLVPDITFVLKVDPQEGLVRAAGRGAHDRMESIGNDFHSRVANSFAHFSSGDWQNEHPECGPIVTVDGSRGEEIVFTEIIGALAARWPATFVAHKGL